MAVEVSQKGAGKLPDGIARRKSSLDVDLPVSSDTQRELLQAQGGCCGTVRKRHRLTLTTYVTTKQEMYEDYLRGKVFSLNLKWVF